MSLRVVRYFENSINNYTRTLCPKTFLSVMDFRFWNNMNCWANERVETDIKNYVQKCIVISFLIRHIFLVLRFGVSVGTFAAYILTWRDHVVYNSIILIIVGEDYTLCSFSLIQAHYLCCVRHVMRPYVVNQPDRMTVTLTAIQTSH